MAAALRNVLSLEVPARRCGTIDWAGLAAELGYADQAHFTRDFTAMVGETQTAYAERCPPDPVTRS